MARLRTRCVDGVIASVLWEISGRAIVRNRGLGLHSDTEPALGAMLPSPHAGLVPIPDGP